MAGAALSGYLEHWEVDSAVQLLQRTSSHSTASRKSQVAHGWLTAGRGKAQKQFSLLRCAADSVGETLTLSAATLKKQPPPALQICARAGTGCRPATSPALPGCLVEVSQRPREQVRAYRHSRRTELSRSHHLRHLTMTCPQCRPDKSPGRVGCTQSWCLLHATLQQPTTVRRRQVLLPHAKLKNSHIALGITRQPGQEKIILFAELLIHLCRNEAIRSSGLAKSHPLQATRNGNSNFAKTPNS